MKLAALTSLPVGLNLVRRMKVGYMAFDNDIEDVCYLT